MNPKAKNLLKYSGFSLLLFLVLIGGIELGFNAGVQYGKQVMLTDISKILSQKGIDFEWTQLSDGSYLFKITAPCSNGFCLTYLGHLNIDLNVVWMRGPTILSESRHAGVLTADGKDFLAPVISSTVTAGIAKYISVSGTLYTPTSSDICVASTTNCANELAANGFTRAAGTYAHTNGTNTWTITHTFTSSGTQTVQTYGLNYNAASALTHNLVASDTSSAKNTISGDTVAVTWTITVS